MNATINVRDEFEKWAIEHDIDIAHDKTYPEGYRKLSTTKFYSCWVCACNRTLTILNESLKRELEKS
jgi:hypothetical protein